MKILITGAQGQVGTELVNCAREAGYDVIAASRAELDITQSENVATYLTQAKPGLVINAAAYTAVDKAEEEPQTAYAINHEGAKNLATACARLKIPLLHISTDYVFDGSNPEPYTENDTPSPLGVYGKSKWLGEEAIREIMPQHIILRVAWVFGAHGNNFVKTMLRLGKERSELNIVADQAGGPTPAKNIAATLIRLADLFRQTKSLAWGTYHYCGTPRTSWYDFAAEIFRYANETGVLKNNIKLNRISTDAYPTPAKRPANSMLDCHKIKDAFKIEMPDWHSALKEVLTELK